MRIKWYDTKMTSNSTPAPFVASASSQYPGYPAWRAFDGNYGGDIDSGSAWISNLHPACWVQIDYGENKKVEVVRITSRNFYEVDKYSPKNFQILGSNDGVDFDLIMEVDNQIWDRNETKEYQFDVCNYRYYRINVLTNNNFHYTSIGEIIFGVFENTSFIFKEEHSNEYYSLTDDALISIPDASVSNILKYGVKSVNDIKFDTALRKIITVVDNGDDSQTVTEEIVEFFNFYDIFSDRVEIICYTDSDNEVDLILHANWSPLDELDGDIEIATWSNETESISELQVSAVPTPKLIYALDVKSLSGKLNSIITTDDSLFYNKSNVRYMITPNNEDWYTFKDGSLSKMESITNEKIESDGMTYDVISELNSDNFEILNFDEFNVGIYLSDNSRNTVISKVSTIGLKEEVLASTPSVSSASFYILNTTATINLQFNGLTLTGELSDEDSTRVQYKVLLNDKPYFPTDGNFTNLDNPPKNIDITMGSDEVEIGKWNTIEVVFKDYFGTEDYWRKEFIGKYASLMFSDENGEYYSTDVGVVLKYLDFGQILTGGTTPSYKVNLKNQYGYDVTDVLLTANTNEFPEGLEVQFSINDEFNNARNSIQFGDLAMDEERPFYIRMRSPITTKPNGNNTFDIYVSAKREV